VVAPADEAQAALAFRVCSANRWSVRAVGAGTWLDAATAAAADVAITTERLRGVLEFEPDDLQLAVGAGTTLADLDRIAREHGQFFAVQPAAAAGATVGATIATDSAGPLRLGHGSPRDHVLGLRLVTGDGRVLDLGGRVVKNVAGYDLVRLVVGGRGALGLISRAHLRLRPLPQRDITAFIRADDPGTLAEVAMHVGEGWPVAAELLDPASAETLTGVAGWLLAVRWHGNDEFAAHVTRWLGGLEPRPELAAGERAGPFWSGLARLEATGTAVIRLAGLPDRLPALLDLASRLTGQSDADKSWSDSVLDSDLGIRWRIAAHARSGLVRVWSDQATATHGSAIRDRLDKVRQGDAGSVIARVLPPPGSDRDAAESAEPAAGPDGLGGPLDRLGRGIRRAFDPAGILGSVGLADGGESA
jgi:glycolate oxidase FAD binding subunit